MRVARVKASHEHATAIVALTRHDIEVLQDALEESLAEFADGFVPPEEALDVERAERIAKRLAAVVDAMDGVRGVP